MSKKLFTTEQILALNANPNVERVSQYTVSFTEDFKKKAYRELLTGKSMCQIFKEHDIDTDALGPVRILKFQQFVNDCSKRDTGFKNMRNEWHKRKSEPIEILERKHFKELEHEVAYLRQMVEFLKKIHPSDTKEEKR